MREDSRSFRPRGNSGRDFRGQLAPHWRVLLVESDCPRLCWPCPQETRSSAWYCSPSNLRWRCLSRSEDESVPSARCFRARGASAADCARPDTLDAEAGADVGEALADHRDTRGCRGHCPHETLTTRSPGFYSGGHFPSTDATDQDDWLDALRLQTTPCLNLLNLKIKQTFLFR